MRTLFEEQEIEMIEVWSKGKSFETIFRRQWKLTKMTVNWWGARARVEGASILLAHHRLTLIDLLEVSNLQPVAVSSLGHQAVDVDFIAEGRSQTVSYREKGYASGWIESVPADLPISVHAHPSVKAMEAINCYVEPTFVAQIAQANR